MRQVALALLFALAAIGCTSAGSELQVQVTDPGEDAELEDPDLLTAEPEPPDFCAVWFDGSEIGDVYQRATWSSDLDEEVRDAWILPLYTAVTTDLVAVLPAEYALLKTYFTALVEALVADPSMTPSDLEDQLTEQLGVTVEELGAQADDLMADFERTCGPAPEITRVEIRDRAELPDHVSRVVGELRLDRMTNCLTSESSIEMIGNLLDLIFLTDQQGAVDDSEARDQLVAVAAGCGANDAEAQMFAWRVTDVDWLWAMLPDGPDISIIENDPVIDPDRVYPDIELLEPPYLGPPEVEPVDPEIAVPEPVEVEPVVPEPAPEVYTYPIEGLVLDVLGTLGIVDEPGACLVDGGVYEPAQLWLDEPGVDPAKLVEQRALLDDVAASCGFGVEHVDEWLALAHQYVAEVAAG